MAYANEDYNKDCVDFVKSLDAEYIKEYPFLGETEKLADALWDMENYAQIGKGEFRDLVDHVDFLSIYVNTLEKFISESKTELSYDERVDAQEVLKILARKICLTEYSIEFDIDEGVLHA